MKRMKVRVGGHWVHTLIGCEDLDYTFRRPYGCWEASFQATVGDGWRHPAFVEGALVEVRYGGDRPWYGVLNEPNWQTGEMTAKGMIRVLEDYRARYWDLELGLVPTWNPQVAIDDVISPNALSGRTAVPIRRDNSVLYVDLARQQGLRDPEPMQLLDLLDLATEMGYGIPWIGGDGVLRWLPDPTTRTWSVHPRVVDIGNAGGEDTATRIFVIYTVLTGLVWDFGAAYTLDDVVWWAGQLWKALGPTTEDDPSADGSTDWTSIGEPVVWSSVTNYEIGTLVNYRGYVYEWNAGGESSETLPGDSGWILHGQLPYDDTTEASNGVVKPYREAPEVDARGLGPMSSDTADEIAAAALAEALMPSYTSDIDVTPVTVTGQHGTPIVVVSHQANELGRVHGVADPRLGQPFIDPISAEYQVKKADAFSPTGLIKVVGKEARGYLEVMQAVIEARQRESRLGNSPRYGHPAME